MGLLKEHINESNKDVLDEFYMSPLHYACSQGHNRIIRFLVQEHKVPIDSFGASNSVLSSILGIFIRQRREGTGLHYACANGRIETISLLVNELRADVNACDSFGRSALTKACLKGEFSLAAFLITLRAQFYPRSNLDGLLYRLAHGQNVRSLELLIAQGIPINKPDENGLTALFYAAQSGHVESVQLLLNQGSNINAINRNGETPLYYAVKGGNLAIAELLINNGANLGVVYQGQRTILHVAVSAGVVPVVDVLLARELEINAVDSHGNSALHIAANIGNEDMVTLLLGHQPQMKRVNLDGETALSLAVLQGNLNVVEKILAAATLVRPAIVRRPLLGKRHDYSEVKRKLEQGLIVSPTIARPPLHSAVALGDLAMINLLLKNNANVEQRDAEQNKPIYYAIHMGRLDIVKVFLESGASLKHIGSTTSNVLALVLKQWALGLQGDWENMIDLLLHRQVPVDEKVLKRAASLGDIPLLKKLLNKKPSTFIMPSSLIHKAAYHGHHDMIHFLLATCFSGREKNEQGRLPLHEAAMGGNTHIFEELLLLHPDTVNALDNAGHTPLHCAVFGGNKEVVNLLIQRGCDINAVDTFGNTPLAIAAAQSDNELVELLRQHGGKLTTSGNVNDACDDIRGVCGLQIQATHLYDTMRSLDIPIHNLRSRAKVVTVTGSVELLAPVITFVKGAETKNEKLLNTLLREAAYASNKHAMEFLLHHGASIDSQDKDSCALLHRAAVSANTKLLQLALDFHPRIDLPDDYGWTPLFYAVFKGELVIIETLIGEGANCNHTNTLGHTPLHMAVMRNNIKAIELLLSQKSTPINLDQACHGGLTALHYAVACESLESIALLIARGAAVSIADNRGLTPLHLAMFCHPNISSKIINLLLENKALIDSRCANRWTPLHIVCSGLAGRTNSLEIIDLLVKNGAQINGRNNNGFTPLHFALFRRSLENVNCLLSHNADMYLESNGGVSSRNMAILTDKNGSLLESFKVGDEELLSSRCIPLTTFSSLVDKFGRDVLRWRKETIRMSKIFKLSVGAVLRLITAFNTKFEDMKVSEMKLSEMVNRRDISQTQIQQIQEASSDYQEFSSEIAEKN